MKSGPWNFKWQLAVRCRNVMRVLETQLSFLGRRRRKIWSKFVVGQIEPRSCGGRPSSFPHSEISEGSDFCKFVRLVLKKKSVFELGISTGYFWWFGFLLSVHWDRNFSNSRVDIAVKLVPLQQYSGSSIVFFDYNLF